jgi:gluconolactonase
MKTSFALPSLFAGLCAACLSLDRAAAQAVKPAMPEEFAQVVATNATVRKLAGGLKFTEGPVWLPRAGGLLVFSDIPASELKSWSTKDGVKSFRQPSGNANGNALDRQGRLLTCEHSGRRLSRTEADGTVVALAERFEGKKFNSPNDLVVDRQGVIWFTDPDYGLGAGEREYGGCWVFRLDPASQHLRAVLKDFDKPNGIALSPDGQRLYVADSGKPHHIRAFDVGAGGSLTNDRVFCTVTPGAPDGIRCDADGRVWTSAGDGVQVFAPDGRLLGRILVPETPANLCFGGVDGRLLFITARTSLYMVPVLVRGAE